LDHDESLTNGPIKTIVFRRWFEMGKETEWHREFEGESSRAALDCPAKNPRMLNAGIKQTPLAG
jgi:hypothetical protein